MPKQQQQKVIPEKCFFNWEDLSALQKERDHALHILGTGKLYLREGQNN